MSIIHSFIPVYKIVFDLIYVPLLGFFQIPIGVAFGDELFFVIFGVFHSEPSALFRFFGVIFFPLFSVDVSIVIIIPIGTILKVPRFPYCVSKSIRHLFSPLSSVAFIISVTRAGTVFSMFPHSLSGLLGNCLYSVARTQTFIASHLSVSNYFNSIPLIMLMVKLPRHLICLRRSTMSMSDT